MNRYPNLIGTVNRFKVNHKVSLDLTAVLTLHLILDLAPLYFIYMHPLFVLNANLNMLC